MVPTGPHPVRHSARAPGIQALGAVVTVGQQVSRGGLAEVAMAQHCAGQGDGEAEQEGAPGSHGASKERGAGREESWIVDED